MDSTLEAVGLRALNAGYFPVPDFAGAALNGAPLTSFNPATGQPIGEFVPCDVITYDRLIDRARRAFPIWSALPARQRGACLRTLGDVLSAQASPLAMLLSAETGLLAMEASAEVERLVQHALGAADQAMQLDEMAGTGPAAIDAACVRWRPVGPVGVITKFNSPLAAWASVAMSAAVRGNTVIWKPSRQAPLTALAVHHLIGRVFEDGGLPEVFFAFLPEHGRLLDRFVRDAGLDVIAYAGSAQNGREIAARIATRFGRVLLDLPGNNAIVVDRSADLDAATDAILSGALAMSGQRAFAIRRLLVHDEIRGELLERLEAAYDRLTIDSPRRSGSTLGPVINAAALAAFETTLRKVEREGGNVLWGGNALDRAGYFLRPAVVAAENHWETVQGESLLPILYVVGFDAFDEAMALQNAVPYASAVSLFTQEGRHAAQFLSMNGCQAACASINTLASPTEFGLPSDLDGGMRAGCEIFLKRSAGPVVWHGEPFLMTAKRKRGRPPNATKTPAATL